MKNQTAIMEKDTPVSIENSEKSIQQEQSTNIKHNLKWLFILLTIISVILSLIGGTAFGISISNVFTAQDGITDSYDLFDEHGLVIVKSDDKYGYIDSKGTYVINPQFDDANIFIDSVAIVKVNDKYGYIDLDGNYIINPQFDYAYSFFDGIALVKSDDKYGYIDKKGKYIINPQFEDANTFVEGLALVKQDDKYGFIDKKGKYVINAQFDDARNFSNGLACVKIGGKWGYIDKSGEWKINCQYIKAYSMHDDGFAIVSTTDKRQIIINKQGEQIGNATFAEIDGCEADFCQKEGCYNESAYDSSYCSDHKTSSSNSYPFCKAYGCLNKAYLGDYCTTHNYLESY